VVCVKFSTNHEPTLTRDAGNAVYVFGSTDSFSGTFSVQIDGKSAASLDGITSTFRQPALLVSFYEMAC
jgi:hypothetical protein